VSGSRALPPRWPPQCSYVVIESSIDPGERLQAGEDLFLISSPLFSIFSLAAILVGSRDYRTHFWKGAIQGSFHKSLVAIGPVVSEEKIFM
jgi:hypothetical protein